MAYSYTWPPSLPQKPLKGFTEMVNATVLRTPMDSGVAKTRYRSKKPNKLSVSFVMTTQQVTTLDTFIRDTIKYTSRFGFTHPRTNQIVEVRILSEQEGQVYQCVYLAPDYWTITMQFEVLP